MLIDIILEGLQVLVIGGGKIGERKVYQLLDSGAKITVVSQEFTSNLINLGSEKQINLVKKKISNNSFLSRLKFKPNIVIVAMNNKHFNNMIFEEAKTLGLLTCVVDNPALCDFVMPAITKVGDFRIAVSTKGKSPAMAGIIRRRVEKMITINDIRQIELQHYARELAKKHLKSASERKRILMGIINNNKIRILLDNNKMNKAMDLVKEIITRNEKNHEFSKY